MRDKNGHEWVKYLDDPIWCDRCEAEASVDVDADGELKLIAPEGVTPVLEAVK